jgi:hypothetical protein
LEWQSTQVEGAVGTLPWKIPFAVLAVKVPLATVSVTQFAQFVAAAEVAWQLVQSVSPLNV